MGGNCELRKVHSSSELSQYNSATFLIKKDSVSTDGDKAVGA